MALQAVFLSPDPSGVLAEYLPRSQFPVVYLKGSALQMVCFVLLHRHVSCHQCSVFCGFCNVHLCGMLLVCLCLGGSATSGTAGL